MECPYCGSRLIEYLGVSDGSGEYGTSLCDEYNCQGCGEYWEEGCFETELFDDPDYDAYEGIEE